MENKPDPRKFYKGNLSWLVDNTIFLTLHGSHAYGTNTPASDVDVKGIAIPPASYYLGLSKSFEQAEFKDPDGVVYEIRKFFKLARDCNPNIIEVLHTDESDWISCSPVGRNIIEKRDLFLSKKAYYTFFGYARAQLKRINTHYRWLKNPPKAPMTRTECGLPERPVIAPDQLSAAMADILKKVESWDVNWDLLEPAERIGMQERLSLMLGELSLSMDSRWVGAAKLLGYEDNFIHYVQKEREYKQKCADWDSYQEWKKSRNPQRAVLEEKFGYDCYTEDTEFLTEKGWQRYDEIHEATKLATVNKDTGVLEYQHYYERVKKPYNGLIMEFETANTLCSVTPNHRMLVSPVGRASSNNFCTAYCPEDAYWHIQSAADLVNNQRSYFHVRSSVHQEVDYTEVSDELLTIIGAYVSEGCVGKRRVDKSPSVLRFSQKEGGRQQVFLDALKNKNTRVRRFEVKRTDKGIVELVYTLADRVIARDVVDWCGEKSANKHLPWWHVRLSTRQAKLLLDVLVAGDGTQRKHSKVYYTSSKQLADDVQSLALIAGFPTKIWGPYLNGEHSPMYQVYIGAEETVDVMVARNEGGSVRQYQYTGNIVCFSVANEILITRKNGKVAIQGNTKHGMHLIRLIRMCKEILTEGKVIVKRPDREELLAIRNGALPYEEMVEWADRQESELASVYQTSTTLRKTPDEGAIDALCENSIRTFLRL